MKKLTGQLKVIGSQESSWLGVPTIIEINEYLGKKLQVLNIEPQSFTDTWDLINLLAKTPAGITNLMRYYYEPTDEDRLLHRKLPSGFHIRLAKSISNRTGQVLITTNRDRLIEWGLASLGITPQIIRNYNDLVNYIPFEQTKCSLIKLNGDYLDWKQPKFDNQLRIFIEDKIQQIYEPVFCRCCPTDRIRLAQFNLNLI